ncbi:lamin tail domain-containing protein, partial [Candidatus Bipolaricaulota bacterium]|nr:lamin tail domain-containing protein [Candidatus Bipolaricaulota bacterium]
MNRGTRIMMLVAVCVSVIGLAALASDLVISEIAWAGTAASSTDEWIELENIGDQSIVLEGWQLVFGDTLIPLGEVAEDTLEVRTVVLAPGAFLVLERTNDESISDIMADLIYKGSLSNDGVLIELRNPQGEVVDSAVLTESGWPAGSASDGDPAFCTMERTSSGEWVSNTGIVRNGMDADGNPLNGTPGQLNSPEVLAQWAPVVDLAFPSEVGTILSGTEWITWPATDPNGTDSALAIAIFISSSTETDWTLVIENLANMGSF